MIGEGRKLPPFSHRTIGHRFTQSHGRLPTGIPVSDHWKGRAKVFNRPTGHPQPLLLFPCPFVFHPRPFPPPSANHTPKFEPRPTVFVLKVFPKFRAFQKPNLPFLNPTVTSAPFPKIRRPLQYPVAPKPKPDRLPNLPLIGFQWPYISPPFQLFCVRLSWS
jgi:hypothetical protein